MFNAMEAVFNEMHIFLLELTLLITYNLLISSYIQCLGHNDSYELRTFAGLNYRAQ